MSTSKATPINQLQSTTNQNDNSLVNDILREIDQTNSQGGELSNDDIAARQAQYQMDPIAQSQQMMQDSDMNQQQMEQQQMEQQMMQQQMMQQQQQQQHQMMGNHNMGDMDTMYNTKPKTLVEIIIEQSKSPIIVAVLCTLLSFKNVDTQIIKFIPKGLNANGEITPIGLITKGLVAGLLFYLVKKFI